MILDTCGLLFLASGDSRLSQSTRDLLLRESHRGYCAISGFGMTGPLSTKPSFDIVTQALTGALSINGERGNMPVKLGIPLGDMVGGVFGPMAILAALHERSHTGRGRLIDISLYDGLIGMFGKEEIPACGFSLGLERILVVMDERGMFPPEIAESTPADVMVTIWNEETIGESLKLANELRSQGIRVTVYPEPDKLGRQIKYADSIKAPFVCVLGESEIAENKVTLKNMDTGDQQTVSRVDLASKVPK